MDNLCISEGVKGISRSVLVRFLRQALDSPGMTHSPPGTSPPSHRDRKSIILPAEGANRTPKWHPFSQFAERLNILPCVTRGFEQNGIDTSQRDLLNLSQQNKLLP
jgi:hypothetical protein